MDFRDLRINLIEDATIATIKRLLDGLDCDECIPCLRQSGEVVRIRRIEVEGNRIIFEAY